jgi:carbonic anhydrase
VDQRRTDLIVESLREGSSRFGERVRANEERRAVLAAGQQPYAAILGCADSRVAAEIAFDVGLGELFVVRVAGAVANTSSIASLEYAVAKLGTRVIVVLAHESCGAVEAAIQGNDAGPNLNQLLSHIVPAIRESGTNDVNTVARCSAELSAKRLTSESDILLKAYQEDGLKILTAFLHFSTGEIDFF